MTQPLPGARAVSAENELDIRGLFRTLCGLANSGLSALACYLPLSR